MRDFTAFENVVNDFVKSSQFMSPNMAMDMRQLGEYGMAQARSDNQAVRMASNAETYSKAGKDDPAFEAVKHEIALAKPKNTHLVTGKPFDNNEFMSREKRPEKVMVELGGYGAGSENIFGGRPVSDLASTGSGVPRENIVNYRWTDRDSAQRALNAFGLAGIPVALSGHSMGGDTVVQMAADNPGVQVTAIDPVGRLSRPEKLPPNVSVSRPDMANYDFSDLVADVGGRYPLYPETETYSGNHMAGSERPFRSAYDTLRPRWTLYPFTRSSRTAFRPKPAPEQPKYGPLRKQGSAFTDWAKEVGHDFFQWNAPPAIHTAAYSVAGAGVSTLAMYLYNRIKGRKTRLRHALMAMAVGGGLGALRSYYRNYMEGKPFDNSNFSLDSIKKGDRVYLGVAGAANGEGSSWFAREMRNRLPNDHVKMFNWGNGKDLEKTYADVLARGGVPVLVGHSRGGKTVAGFLDRHPEAKGYLLDPVSWFGRSHPSNATVFTVDRSTRHGGDIENYIADFGGRWNLDDAGTITHTGTHSNAMPRIISDYVLKGYDRDNQRPDRPWYVTDVK